MPAVVCECMRACACVPGRGARRPRHRKTPGGYTEKWLRGAARRSAHRVGGGSLSLTPSSVLLAACPARRKTQGGKNGK